MGFESKLLPLPYIWWWNKRKDQFPCISRHLFFRKILNESFLFPCIQEFSQEGLVYQNPEWVIKEEGGMEMALMQENNINMNSLNTSNVVYPIPPKTELPGCQMPKNI